jgi:hypothetical protein
MCASREIDLGAKSNRPSAKIFEVIAIRHCERSEDRMFMAER